MRPWRIINHNVCVSVGQCFLSSPQNARIARIQLKIHFIIFNFDKFVVINANKCESRPVTISHLVLKYILRANEWAQQAGIVNLDNTVYTRI